MGKKTELVNLPTKMLAAELGSGKRWKRIAILGLIGGAVLGAAVFAVVRAADARETAALEAAWTDLNGCLLGDALADKETPSTRVEAVQLGVVGVAKDKRGKPGEAPWPSSCAPFAFGLQEHAAAAADKGPALAESAGALAKALKDDSAITSDLSALVDKAWADAGEAKIKLGAPKSTAPKPAVPALSREALAAAPKLLSGNFALSNVRDETSSSGRARFLIDQKEAMEGPAMCTLDGETLRCTKVPGPAAKLSPGLSFVGTVEDRALPFFFAGDRGQLGIFPPNGKEAVQSIVAFGSVARADGSLFLLTRGDTAKDLRLVIAPAAAAATDRTLLPPTEFETAGQTALLWDWLAYKGAAKAGAPAHLFVRKLNDTGVDPAAATDVGEVVDASPSGADKESLIQGCRSDDVLAVRVRGAKNDSVAILAAGRWAAPAKAATHGGALTCHGVEAVVTQVTNVVEQEKNFPIITQARCSSSGCTNVNINVRELLGSISEIAPEGSTTIAAADLGGKVLMVWSGGAVGGLRMRLATADHLKEAEDKVIAPARGENKTSIITELRVVSAKDGAVLLVGTTSGVRALHIDLKGDVKALTTG